MRILYFSFVEIDVPNACKTHTLGVIRGFSRYKCEVDGLIPKPKYVHPRFKGVRFICLWPWRFSKTGKMWLKFLLLIRMIILCSINRYDAIYVRELENNPVPRYCSRLFGIPFYIEINDLLPEYYKRNGSSKRFVGRVKRNQKKDFAQAKGIIVNSVPMGNWIKETYPSISKKVSLIMNGTEQVNVSACSRSEVLARLKLSENGFYLGFLGTIYNRFDFITVFNSIQKIKEIIPIFKFIVVGEGPELPVLKDYVENLQLQDYILFAGFIDEKKLHNYLPAFDLGIIPLTKESTELYGSLPTKFATYACYNLAVITTRSDLSGYPKEIKAGLTMFSPEDSQELSRVILSLYDNPQERQKRASILHDFVVKNLTWEAVTKQIIDLMKKNKFRPL